MRSRCCVPAMEGEGGEAMGEGVSDARRERSRAKTRGRARVRFGGPRRVRERAATTREIERTRASVPPRPYISTLRLSIPGRPPHRHTPPSVNHAQCPHRCLAAFRSEKPSSRASGSDSSGRRPRGAGASASSAGSLIARVERTRRDCATVDLRAPDGPRATIPTRAPRGSQNDARAPSDRQCRSAQLNSTRASSPRADRGYRSFYGVFF